MAVALKRAGGARNARPPHHRRQEYRRPESEPATLFMDDDPPMTTKQSKAQARFVKEHVERLYPDAIGHPAYAMRFGKRKRREVEDEIRETVNWICVRFVRHYANGKTDMDLGRYKAEVLKQAGKLLDGMTFDELRRWSACDRADDWRKGRKDVADE